MGYMGISAMLGILLCLSLVCIIVLMGLLEHEWRRSDRREQTARRNYSRYMDMICNQINLERERTEEAAAKERRP